jgi:ubiquinone/menaquinone biosynthesis C-methylase UbiE
MPSEVAFDPEYLRLAGALLADVKRVAFDLLALAPGQTLLDVGCGPGSDLVEAARSFGGAVAAFGLDSDTRMAREAAQTFGDAGITGSWVCLGEVQALPFQRETFDRVRVDRVLEHLTNPADAVRELLRVTRPGGRVVITDTDWASLSVDLEPARAERRLVDSYVLGDLVNATVARSLPRLCSDAGATSVDVRTVSLHSRDATVSRRMGLFDRVLKRSIEQGLLTEDDAAEIEASLVKRDAPGCFFASLSYVVCAAAR